MRPKLKDSHVVYRLQGNVIQIGDETGYASELEDGNGWVSMLLRLLDGSHTVDQIVEELQLEYRTTQRDDVEEAIGLLDAHGHLEDDASVPHMSTELVHRHTSNLNFYSLFSNLTTSRYSFQEIISQKHVVILGVGGLGTHVALQLTGLGVNALTLVDFDSVERKNLSRQFLYADTDVGKPKLEAAQRRLSMMNPDVSVTVVSKQVQSWRDVMGVIKGADAVVCAADQPALRINGWVNQACVAESVPFLTGGVAGATGKYSLVIPKRTGCLECQYRYLIENDPNAAAIIRQVLTGPKQVNMATAPNISLLASMVTLDLQRLFLGVAPPIAAGRHVSVNFMALEISRGEVWPKLEDCPVCSHNCQVGATTILEEVTTA